VLVVRADTVEIARESFRLTGAPSRGDTSWTLTTTIRYDRARPIVSLNPVLVIDRDSQPRTLQYDVTDDRGRRTILAQLSRARLTVRELSPGVERAREYHAAGRTVILDDSVFALYVVAAWFAGPQPVSVTAVFPRQGRRETLTVRDDGVLATTVNRDPARLRRVTIDGAAAGPVHVWLDPEGRPVKVEAPGRGVRAELLPGG
jgi:hypothetical protein